MPRKPKRKRKRVTGVQLRAEHRQEPDWDRFAFALLQHVRRTSEAKKPSQPKGDA